MSQKDTGSKRQHVHRELGWIPAQAFRESCVSFKQMKNARRSFRTGRKIFNLWYLNLNGVEVRFFFFLHLQTPGFGPKMFLKMGNNESITFGDTIYDCVLRNAGLLVIPI